MATHCYIDVLERSKRIRIAQLLKSDSKPARIIENLYLGSVGSAYNYKVLKTLRITHILTVCECLPPKFINEFKYKVVSVSDMSSTKLSIYFEDCLSFIQRCIESNGRVLVHCFAGISRSATIIIAYLLKHSVRSLKEAYALVCSRRPFINPNIGFHKQLLRYEALQKQYRKHR